MKKCRFECKYWDPEVEECEPIGGECIGDMCECWECCHDCRRKCKRD